MLQSTHNKIQKSGLLPTPPLPEDAGAPDLTENAAAVFTRRYVRKGTDGEPMETLAETFWRVADRGRAIFFATEMARAGDIVLVCGKGHEQSMCFGTTEYPWDDRDAMRAALRGAPLLTLPTAG